MSRRRKSVDSSQQLGKRKNSDASEADTKQSKAHKAAKKKLEEAEEEEEVEQKPVKKRKNSVVQAEEEKPKKKWVPGEAIKNMQKQNAHLKSKLKVTDRITDEQSRPEVYRWPYQKFHPESSQL